MKTDPKRRKLFLFDFDSLFCLIYHRWSINHDIRKSDRTYFFLTNSDRVFFYSSPASSFSFISSVFSYKTLSETECICFNRARSLSFKWSISLMCRFGMQRPCNLARGLWSSNIRTCSSSYHSSRSQFSSFIAILQKIHFPCILPYVPSSSYTS